MFRNKNIKEYKRISNSVKLPDIKESIGQEKNKILKLNEKENRNDRGNRNMKKLIASGLIAAALGGIVILNNVGGEKVNNDIVVYASENDGEKVKLEKEKELIINTVTAKTYVVEEETLVKHGIGLDIVSEDMRVLKLKTDKGELDNGKVEIFEDKNGEIVLQEENTKEIEVEFKKEDKEMRQFVYWYYDNEMSELRRSGRLSKDILGTVNIQMEAIYEDGRMQVGVIQLSLNENGELVGKIS